VYNILSTSILNFGINLQNTEELPLGLQQLLKGGLFKKVNILKILIKTQFKLLCLLVCREWLVHEDGALAHQLQDQESKATFTKLND